MTRVFKTLIVLLMVIMIISCSKKNEIDDNAYTYYLVGFDTDNANWKDTAFVVRTLNQQLIQKADAQLELPVAERQIVTGKLVNGSDGFNKNASYEFKWHFDENDWDFADVTVEIYDGKPFTDVDADINYWLGTVKRFGAWSSYIKKKLPGKP